MTEHKIQDLIVVSRKDIEDSIKELRKSQIDSLANSINSNIANHLVELIANSASLEPVVKEALSHGELCSIDCSELLPAPYRVEVDKYFKDYISNTKISIP